MTVRGINKVIIVGNLGQDPEVRYMPNGGAVANLSLATSESWRDKQTGEPRQQVRDQMQRTEREWVVNVPEKEIELEKTLGGD